MNEDNVKKNVREFYNQVGWQTVNDALYQNAQYEDLRPVSQEYIHRCHLRVNKHLAEAGEYLLDAGSGPVQYPEYLTYSEGYARRVCMDISIVALKEARKRLGDHGLFVVGDVAWLPFKSDVFDGVVSLHTVHHVPMAEKLQAYDSLHRVLIPGKTMVLVDGWTNAPLMSWLSPCMHFMRRFRGWWLRRIKKETPSGSEENDLRLPSEVTDESASQAPAGTFVKKLNAEWLIEALAGRMDAEILVWRSVSVSFLRSVIYPDWGGRFWLKVLFWLEERFPRLFGRVGQYPLVVVEKPAAEDESSES